MLRSLLRRANRLKALGPTGPALLAETGLLLIRVRLALTFSSLTNIQRELLPARELSAEMAPAYLARMAWCVRHTARLVPQASCLTQGLVLQKLLHRRGVASELKVGVRRDGPGELAAHAWVVVGDRVVLGGTARDLAPFSPIAKFSTGLK